MFRKFFRITNQYLYGKYGNGFEELYDLIKGPNEFENIGGSADQGFLEKLSVWLKDMSM